MPAKKRRAFEIRQKQKAGAKRKKLLTLNKGEAEKLSNFKAIQSVIGMDAGRGSRKRKLDTVNMLHKKDFPAIVVSLSKKFPGQEIRVLDEGSGFSSFSRRLEKEVGEKAKVKTFRTDIDNKAPWAAHITPEELRKTFGDNSFHLVVSTYGGITYTPVSQKKALANVIAILKPGGIASILSIENKNVFSGAKSLTKETIKGLEKRFKNISIKLEDLGESMVLLTIKKRV